MTLAFASLSPETAGRARADWQMEGAAERGELQTIEAFRSAEAFDELGTV